MINTRIRLNNAQRSALRRACSAHPNWEDYRIPRGLDAGKLSKDLLWDTLDYFGIDAAAILASVDTNANADATRTAPVTVGDARTVDTDAVDTDAVDTDAVDTDAVDDIDAVDTDAEPLNMTGQTVADILSGPVTTLADRIAAALDSRDAHASIIQTQRDALENDLRAARAEIANQAAQAAQLPAQSTIASPATPVHIPATRVQRGAMSTLGQAFGKAGAAIKDRPVQIWEAGNLAPSVDRAFNFDADLLLAMAIHIENSRPIFLCGPAGTGKTSIVEQYAARTGRPFTRVSFEGALEAPELIGMVVPSPTGHAWVDGQLAAAMRIPGNVILLDEISIGTDAALAALHAVLDSGTLHVRETGEVIRAADGVTFVAADNTAGTGDQSGIYGGTHTLNAALRDRFDSTVHVGWLTPAAEAKMVSARSGCTRELAAELVSFAGITRASADGGSIVAGLGPRRLIAFARSLHAGLPADTAWRNTIATGALPEDRETLEQLRAQHMDLGALERLAQGLSAAAPDAAQPATRPENARAQSDFDAIEV